MKLSKLITYALLAGLCPNVRAEEPMTDAEHFAENFQTLFVFEMNRHGARSHYMGTSHLPTGFWGPGVKDGFLTWKGRVQHQQMGLSRREEYIKQKKLLSEKFDPKEILSMSTFKERCHDSGVFFLHGLFPLQNIKF